MSYLPTQEIIERTKTATVYLEDGAREEGVEQLRKIVADYDAGGGTLSVETFEESRG